MLTAVRVATPLRCHRREKLLNDVYNYWAAKRKRWGKPIMRRLQAPTLASDTNPYNTFRCAWIQLHLSCLHKPALFIELLLFQFLFASVYIYKSRDCRVMEHGRKTCQHKHLMYYLGIASE